MTGGWRMMPESILRRFWREGAWLGTREPRGGQCQRLLQALPLRLLQQPGSEAPLLELGHALQRQVQARQVVLLQDSGQGGMRPLASASTGCAGRAGCPLQRPAELPPSGCLMTCADCRERGRQRLVCGVNDDQAVLMVDFERVPSEAMRHQVREVGRGLGDVLRVLAEDRRQRRRELVAERGVLSRELHDSVAQQLSYLQIRASRLQQTLGTLPETTAADEMLDDFRVTLQRLHRQIRELITSSRLTMDGRSLREAIEASVDEFSRRSACVFALDNRLPEAALPPEAELQVLQVVRESLANVVRHSHAQRVQISLCRLAADSIEVRIEDDGIGLPPDLPAHSHFGLRIMAERAEAIGARLHIEAARPRGTCVRLLWSSP